MRSFIIILLLQQLAGICYNASCVIAFSREAAVSSSSTTTFSSTKTKNNNNILILDHLNINHQKGRHDWLKSFYFDFLQCAVDPRKIANIDSGRKTLWANVGSQQFHLPEGKPNAQILDGVITLVYPDLSKLKSRLNDAQEALAGSSFKTSTGDEGELMVVDPWGSNFRLVAGTDNDTRGKQPGDTSEGLAMRDLTIHVPVDSNLEGIGRFYEQVLGGCVSEMSKDYISIQVGPTQTLTFRENPQTTIESHVDMRDETTSSEEGDSTTTEVGNKQRSFLSNYGPHVSMYVADLPTSYQQADGLGVAYVNPRFKRRAYTLEEAVDDCMYRCIDIVDPENVNAGPILKLEHEVRSVIKRDGSKYKSCPFDEIPNGCVTL